MTRPGVSERQEGAAAAFREAQARVGRAVDVGATAATSFALLVTTLDFVLFGVEGPWAWVLTATQTLLVALALMIAAERDRKLKRRVHPARRLLYFGGLSLIASLALLPKWRLSLLPGAAERLAQGETYRVMGAALTLCIFVAAFGRERRLTRYVMAFAEHPARQTALSFAVLSLLGSFLLTLPASVRVPEQVSFIDSLFMSTSAVCVTGLAVHGVTEHYTPLGQGILLALIQVGGLGIMVLSASLTIVLGRRLQARSSAVLAEVLDTPSIASLRGSLMRIVGLTLLIEAAGTVLLYWVLAHTQLDQGAREAISSLDANLWWVAMFHAVSAFCNAGFSLLSDSLVPLRGSYWFCSVIMLLILLGGLGFPVLSEVASNVRDRVRRRRPPKLTLHTRVVLSLSALLTLGLALVFALSEWRHALSPLPWEGRVFAGLFQSVTLRTAGFNVVPLSEYSAAGLLIACLFMFVGASPGGTGGGVKVTTFAAVFSTFRAELRGESAPTLFDRELPQGTVRRAVSVCFIAVVVVTFASLALLFFEDAQPMHLVFEAVSAFGTVGLSADVTGALSTPGKLAIMLTMLIGRIGPLTLALAASDRRDRAHHAKPEERVLIG